MVMSMVELLTMMMREAGGPRNAHLRKTCKEALEVLKSDEVEKSSEPYQLRESCLVPLQLAIESRSVRLAQHALVGIQRLLVEEPFQTVMESEEESKWQPIQILNALWWAPNLPDDLQVEVMKIILNMTFSTNWCMNAKVITKITELSFSIFLTTSKPNLRSFVAKALNQILRMFHRRKGPLNQLTSPSLTKEKTMHESRNADSLKQLQSQLSADVYGTNSQNSVRTAVKATLTQLLTSIAERLTEKHTLGQNIPDEAIADFTNDASAEVSSLSKDVIEILRFLCGKLREATSPGATKHPEPLLLEGILSILSNVPTDLSESEEFTDLIWQDLCPSLVVLLGNPLNDKSVTSQKTGSQDEMGRGSGCSSSAPNLATTCAKTIYSIAMELVRLVGTMRSMRPVLESLFHRMLLYPPPVHRHEALRAVKEVVSSPERLMNLAGPTLSDGNETQQTFNNCKRRRYQDIALLKLVIDAVQECCHCNDSSVCITSVDLVDNLLTSVEMLVKGDGLSDQMITEIHRQYREVESTYHGITYVNTVLVPESMAWDENTERTTVIKYSDLASSDSDTESSSDYGPENSEGESDGEQERACMMKAKKRNEEHCEEKTDGKKTEGSEMPRLHDQDEITQFGPLTGDRNYEAIEKESAQQYIERLVKFLPKLLATYGTEEVDTLILDFSSAVCSELCADPSQGEDNRSAAILNSDGLYMATYNTLLLNLKLIRCGYYISDEKSLPISEKQFVDDILGCGLLLYLSPAWLKEVYRHVIQRDFLSEAGYHDTVNDTQTALVQVLTDIDGLGSRKIGGQFLCGFRECTTPSAYEKLNRNPVAHLAGMKFARRIVQACWEGILDVLSVLLSGRSACGITSSISLLLGGKEESRRAREAICTSLNGLQKAARLSCVLGLQDRCGGVFAQLAGASCILEELRKEEKRLAMKAAIPGAGPPRTNKMVHSAQALSLDVVLSIGLEMGSHSADCWRHVFSCCAHVSEMEHVFFSHGQNQTSLPKVQQEQQQIDTSEETYELDDGPLYAPVVISSEPVAPSINVPELIRETCEEGGWDGAGAKGEILPGPQAAKVLCGLSQAVDRMFEDSATKLNMKALVGFLTELCRASKVQLSNYGSASSKAEMPTNSLHLYRLGDIMMRCLGSERPLMHIMTAWSVVAPYLVEAACHRDHTISKKAVDCIHEFVTSLLSRRQEIPHSHFNESLCKPFENLLCLELCDGDVQDQVVCSICELVETCTTEIKSGWRSLFGSLRAVKIEYTTVEEVNEDRQRHIAAVLDVFNVFLNTDNTMVFANAAVDCILCLLKYVKGPGEFEESAGDDDTSDSGSELDTARGAEDLCLPALRYLEQCCSILSSMWGMPKCPVFKGAHRIRCTAVPKCIDPVIPDFDLEDFQKPWVKESTVAKDFQSGQASPASSEHIAKTKDNLGEGGLTPDSTSLDSGIGVINSESSAPSESSSPVKDEEKTSDKPMEENQEELEKSGECEDVSKEKPEADKCNNQDVDKNVSDEAESTVEKVSGKAISQVHSLGTTREENESHLSCGDNQLHLTTLDELDNHTGVLHVWFLVFEGLATTASAAPKNFQPQTLETLFNLLRSAAQVPGPKFALHCVNHLLLPMLQSWLRRGNQVHGFWDTAAANFKQCCGLCTDLVVEFIIQFASVAESHASVVFMLKQMLSVLIECVAQSNESLSRLGCSCIRHCLQSTGNLLSEDMWHVAVTAISHAFDVTLYCLRQLMTPFHADSDNFYGDIGHVKVAVRKDCSGIECERLRHLAQQVLLLDSQRGTNSVIDYEAEEDRSYIFLIYPPNQDASDNPSITRVPFRSIVVGLLSHQLLVQMVGALLLQGAKHVVPVERSMLTSSIDADSLSEEDPNDLIQDAPLPGMLRHLSTRNVLVLLQCLLTSYRTATEFDARPGLKFLMQKVSRASVAANLYKQSCISMTLYIHTMLEICAHQDNIHLDNTHKVLSSKQSVGSTKESHLPMLAPTSRSIYAPLLPVLTPEYLKATESTDVLQTHMVVFMRMFKAIFDEVCTTYVDLYLDQEGPSKADKLSTQMLVFLLAEPEELPQLKRDKSISEMVKEKLEAKKQKANESDNPTGLFTKPVAVQETEEVSDSIIPPLEPQRSSVSTTSSTPSSPEPERQKRPQEDKVYTVATDKTIRSLMSEYKKRKQAHSMPTFVKAQRSKPALPKIKKSLSNDPIDQEIQDQQISSIMKEGPSKADKLSTQMLVFLLAEPEELPQLKRDKSISEMVKEKLEAKKQKANESDNPTGLFTKPVAVQETEEVSDSIIPPLEPQRSSVSTTSSTPSSPEPERQKRPQEDKVYTVATDKTIRSLMSEYKKRKQAHSMPTFVKAQRSKPALPKIKKSLSNDPIDQEIQDQQISSIMKDSEAHLTSWIEMLVSVLSLYHQLPDFQHRALLPAVFNCVNQLICHCKDGRLREALAQWVYRIGHMFGMAPLNDPLPVCR